MLKRQSAHLEPARVLSSGRAVCVGRAALFSRAVRTARQHAGHFALVGASLVMLAAGCGGTGDETAPPPLHSMGGQQGFGGLIIGGCDGDESLERECTVYITQASGVTSCYSGIQYCRGGEWSDCNDTEHDPRIE